MSIQIRCVGVMAAVLCLASFVGCGADTSNSVSAPPAMTPDEHAESMKRQAEHYAAPSNADRMQSSN